MPARKPSEHPEDPHENDVLSGLPGHKYFRQLVKKRGKIYSASLFQSDKQLIAASIVSAIRNLDPPGRFLSRDLETGFFYDIGDVKAMEKTKQALAKTKQAPGNKVRNLQEAEKETKAKDQQNKVPSKSEVFSQQYTPQYASQYAQQYAQQYAKQYACQYNQQHSPQYVQQYAQQYTKQYALQQSPFAHRPGRSSAGPSKSEVNAQQRPSSVYKTAQSRPSNNDFGQPSIHHAQVPTLTQHFQHNKSMKTTVERVGRQKRQVAKREQVQVFQKLIYPLT